MLDAAGNQSQVTNGTCCLVNNHFKGSAEAPEEIPLTLRVARVADTSRPFSGLMNEVHLPKPTSNIILPEFIKDRNICHRWLLLFNLALQTPKRGAETKAREKNSEAILPFPEKPTLEFSMDTEGQHKAPTASLYARKHHLKIHDAQQGS